MIDPSGKIRSSGLSRTGDSFAERPLMVVTEQRWRPDKERTRYLSAGDQNARLGDGRSHERLGCGTQSPMLGAHELLELLAPLQLLLRHVAYEGRRSLADDLSLQHEEELVHPELHPD